MNLQTFCGIIFTSFVFRNEIKHNIKLYTGVDIDLAKESLPVTETETA